MRRYRSRLRSWTVGAWFNWTMGDFKRVSRVFVCLLRQSKTHAFITSVAFELLNKFNFGHFILLVCKVKDIAVSLNQPAIALHHDMCHAKIFEIERVPLISSREIGIVYQTIYDLI